MYDTMDLIVPILIIAAIAVIILAFFKSMKEINDKTYLKTNYKQIFQDENNNVFDEWQGKIVNINVLAPIYNIPTYYESFYVNK